MSFGVGVGSAGADGERSSGALGVQGLTERKLRAFEERVLGAVHAAEHAAQRKVSRRRGAFKRAAKSRKVRPRGRAAAVGPLHEVGRWNGRFPIGGVDGAKSVMAINAAVLPTGKVLWYSYPNEPDSAPRKNESWALLWDPNRGTGPDAYKRVDPPIDLATGRPANIWCSGTSFLADGRVLVTGGNLSYYQSSTEKYAGLKKVYTFNPFNETWTEQPDMAHGRWYPSQMLMPDGRTIILQGLDENKLGAKNTDVEVFTPNANLDGRGAIAKLGTLPSAYVGDYYPHTFWMPSGRGFIGGPFSSDSWWLNNPGTANTFSITDAANSSRSRVWGTGVQVPGEASKVMQIGGSNTSPSYENAPATATTETFNETANAWSASPSINIGRGHHNTVLLPDGSMATVGGGVGNTNAAGTNRLWTGTEAQKQIELWDPVARTWKLGPPQLETRAYHSTAVLLPDGRVISAGDDRNGGFDRDSLEVYEPAYLFNTAGNPAPRPVITRAPTLLGYGKDFYAEASGPAPTRAVLIAPSAVTHAVDMNQRYVPLQVTSTAGGRINLKTPANANLAPGGYYMLFLLDADGTPSKATWLRLANNGPGDTTGGPDTVAPSVSVSAPAAGARVSGVVGLAASASDNVGVASVQFRVDGVNVGAADVSAPFGVSWDSTSVAAGTHSVSAVARDAAGNATTSAAVSVTVDNSTSPPPPPVGLVAAFGFNEGAGSSAADATGRGHAGVVSGATWVAGGRYGGALSFDGVDDWVTVADADDLDFGGKVTVSAWIKPSVVGTWDTVVMKEKAGGYLYGLYGSSSVPRANGSAGGPSVYGPSTSPTTANVWRHLAYTHDGATGRLYYDGVLVGSLAGAQAPGASTNPLRIGGNAVWASEFFTGVIDDVRVYDRA